MRNRALAAVFLLTLGCSGTTQQPKVYFPANASAPAPAGAIEPPPPAVVVTSPTPNGYQGLGVESLSPETLRRYAPTPLPDAERRQIQAMMDLRAPSGGILTDDGKKLFFSWTITGTAQVFRQSGPMGFPTQLTGGEDPTRLVEVTPDGQTVIVSRDRNGEENPGLYWLSESGGPLVEILHKPKVQAQFQALSKDGKSVYFRANDVTAESYAIYRYDLPTRATTRVFGEPGIWSLVGLEGEGASQKLLLEKSVGSNQTEVYEWEKGALRHLIGKDEKEDYVARYGARGEVLILTPKLGEFRRLHALRDGVLTPVSKERSADVTSFSVDEAKKRIALTVNEAGYLKTEFLDAVTRAPLPGPALSGDHVMAGATTRGGRFTVLTVDPGTGPTEATVYDWTQKKLVPWHRPSTPEIDTRTFAKATLESYAARDGVKIPLFVRRPAACAQKLCPVVVAFHGGPEAQTMAGFSIRAQLFVDAGFIYAEPNVRGSDGYGKSWIHADDGPKRLAVVSDIEDAAIAARKAFSFGGQSPKVGIYGGSYGGYSVLMGMSKFAGAYDVGVSVVGISSLVTFLENTAPYRRILRISEYGDPTRDRDALTELSPITHVDRVKAPLMLLQGATDPRVPAGEALQFHEALTRKGVPSELMIFPDEGHGFQKRSNQVLAAGHTIRFFKTHLK